MPEIVDYIADTPIRSSEKSKKETGVEQDAMSTLLLRLKLRARVYLRADFCGDWAVDTSGERRAPFHLLTRGTGWLHEPGAPARLMTPGDLVVFPADSSHMVSR